MRVDRTLSRETQARARPSAIASPGLAWVSDRTYAWLNAVLAAVALLDAILALVLPSTGPLAALTILLGPGLVAVWSTRIRHAGAAGLLAVLVSHSVLILVSMGALWFGWWHPTKLHVLMSGSVFVAASVAAWRCRHLLRTTDARLSTLPRISGLAPTLLSATGFLLGVGVALVGRRIPEGNGFLWSVSPLWYFAALIVLTSVFWAWWRQHWLGGPIIALGVLVPACQAAMYGMPAVAVAARHVGLVRAMTAHGVLDPSADIYQAWAGLFSATALIAEACGWTDLFTYATFWGVAASALSIIATRLVAAPYLGPRSSWLAGLTFALATSLNTSFFAPQVYGFVVGMAIAAIATQSAAGLPTVPDLPQGATSARVALILVLSVALAVTHQLTPYMIFATLALLAVASLNSPRWLPLLVLIPAVLFAWVNRDMVGHYLSPDMFGRLLTNLMPPERPATSLTKSLWVKNAIRLPMAGLLVLGLAALWSLIRRRERTEWGLACAAASPAVVMLGTSYGGEGIFRVTMFAVPWLAILSLRNLPVLDSPAATRAGVVQPSVLRSRRRAWAVVTTVGLFAVQAIGLTGMDANRFIRGADVRALEHFESRAPVYSTLVVIGTNGSAPTSLTENYLFYRSVSGFGNPPRVGGPEATGTGPTYEPERDLRRIVAGLAKMPDPVRRDAPLFAYLSDAQIAFDDQYAQQGAEDHRRLYEAIRRSSQWRPFFRGSGVEIYEFTGELPEPDPQGEDPALRPDG